MLETLAFITPTHLAMVPIVIGVVSMFKNFTWFNSAYSPVAALVLGVGAAALIGGAPIVVIVAGVVIGLSASGLYSGTAAVIKG